MRLVTQRARVSALAARQRAAGRAGYRLAVCLVAGLALLAAPLPARAQVARPQSTTAGTTDGTSINVLQLWAPKYMSRAATVSQPEAVAQAKRFPVIIATTSDYPGYAAAMHAANPQLELFAYLNGTFAGGDEGSAYPASWYVRDPSGRQVRSHKGHYMMDPTNPGWISNRISECQSLLRSSGFDGCGLDVLGTAPVDATGYVTGTPINAGTGQPWTPAEWLAATTRLAAGVRSAIAPKLVAGNGVGNGPRYFYRPAPSSQLFDGADVGMAEVFLRGGRDPLSAYPTVEDWRANVDMLVNAETAGRSLVVVTKVWNVGTQAQKDAWHKFALASFLLGAGGHVRFNFTYSLKSDPATWHPWWGTALGAPSAPYYARGDGTYARDFIAGKVLVNPGTASRVVKLGASYTTLDGRTVTAVTLAPHAGEVLVR